MSELNPCPFCHHSDAEVRRACGGAMYVECTRCEAEGPPWMTEEGAIRRWNFAIRSTDTIGQELFARLERELAREEGRK